MTHEGYKERFPLLSDRLIGIECDLKSLQARTSIFTKKNTQPIYFILSELTQNEAINFWKKEPNTTLLHTFRTCHGTYALHLFVYMSDVAVEYNKAMKLEEQSDENKA
jgi:hypothetical protein